MKRQEIETTSKIIRAVVYGDRASVTRLYCGKVSEGKVYLLFPDLPGNLDEATLRARISATVAMRLGNVEMITRYLPDPAPKKEAQLKEQVQEMEDELARLAAEHEILLERRDFLQNLEQGSRSEIPQSLARNILSSEDARTIWSEIFNDLAATATHIQTKEREMRDTEKELDVFERELAQLRSLSGDEVRIVEVMLDADEEGKVEVELEYTVMGASWEPVYDLRLDSESSKIEMEMGALVRQQTGEDWLDAELHLSTATPDISLDPPETEPIYLSLYAPAPQAPMSSGHSEPMKKRARNLSDEVEAEEDVEYCMASLEEPFESVAPQIAEVEKGHRLLI